jgi:hypothetical protein
MHQLTHRPSRLAAAVAALALALAAALIALPRDQAAATPPSGVTAEVLARGTVAHAARVRVAGAKLQTRGPVDVATVHVTFQAGGSTPDRPWSPSGPASSPFTAPRAAARAPSAPARRSSSSVPRTSTSPATRPAP